jgi:hypothetical protein
MAAIAAPLNANARELQKDLLLCRELFTELVTDLSTETGLTFIIALPPLPRCHSIVSLGSLDSSRLCVGGY